MHFRLTLLAALAILPSTIARTEDGSALYGPPRQEVLEMPNLRIDTKQRAAFKVHILPWREAPDTTLEDQLQRILDTPPPGESFAPATPPKLIQVGRNFAISMPVAMKAERANERISLFFACDYKGKKQHFREMVFVGETLDVLAVGKKSVLDQINARAAEVCKERPSDAKRAALRQLVSTAPGDGDGAARLKHMIFALKQGTNAYGTFQVTYSSYALFDDGWATRGTRAPLPDFDVEASRKVEPKSWAKWRETKPGRFELSWPRDDGEEKWSGISGSYRTIDPYPDGARLSGRYSYWASYGPLFDGGTTVNKSYAFQKDGTYSTTSSSMSSSADIMGSTVNRVRTEGPDGCNSATAISGGIVGAQSKSDPACGDGKAGTYEIEPWVLTLHANNGRTKRFTFFPTGENSFYLNGQDWGKK